MKKEDNKIFFADDQEFYDFAVKPYDVFNRTDTGILYHDWEFTGDYEKAIENGTELIIEDPKSSIVKHGCAVFRTVCKPVKVKGMSRTAKSNS